VSLPLVALLAAVAVVVVAVVVGAVGPRSHKHHTMHTALHQHRSVFTLSLLIQKHSHSRLLLR